MTRTLSFVRSAAMFASAAFLASTLLSSCLKNHNDVANTPVAEIMTFNLAPDKSSVGFSISGNSLTASPLGYGNYSGNYLNIYPGDRTVNTYDFYSAAGPYASVSGTFAADKFYSVFFVGVNNNYKNILVQDNYDSLSASSGKAYVRYVNGIPDSINALNVTLSSGGTVVSQNDAVFGTVSSFIEVGAGDLSVAIKSNSDTDTSRTIAVEAKKAYTILLSGIRGSSTPVEIKYISNGTLSDAAANTSAIGNRTGSVN